MKPTPAPIVKGKRFENFKCSKNRYEIDQMNTVPYALVVIKALVWFWWIDETLSANLVHLSDHEIGIIISSGEATVKIIMMVMPWWWSSAWTWKRRKRKIKTSRQMWNLYELFGLVIEALREWSHLGSIAVLLKGVKLVSKYGYQSATRCYN